MSKIVADVLADHLLDAGNEWSTIINLCSRIIEMESQIKDLYQLHQTDKMRIEELEYRV